MMFYNLLNNFRRFYSSKVDKSAIADHWEYLNEISDTSLLIYFSYDEILSKEIIKETLNHYIKFDSFSYGLTVIQNIDGEYGPEDGGEVEHDIGVTNYPNKSNNVLDDMTNNIVNLISDYNRYRTYDITQIKHFVLIVDKIEDKPSEVVNKDHYIKDVAHYYDDLFSSMSHLNENINKYADDNFIYLVKFSRVSNRTKSKITYTYLPYNRLYTFSLIKFFSYRDKYKLSLSYEQFNDSAYFIDSNILNKNEVLSFNNYLKDEISVLNKIDFYDTDLIKKLTFILSNEEISNLINGIIRNNTSVVSSVLNSNLPNFKFNKDLHLNQKFENNCIFLVDNLEQLKSMLNNLGLKIKICKGKDGVNSLHTHLSMIDLDFRRDLISVYNSSKVSNYLSLNKSSFSFRNIHLRNGGVRRYHSFSGVNRKSYLISGNLNVFNVNKRNYVTSMDNPSRFIKRILSEVDEYGKALSLEDKQRFIEKTTIDGFITEKENKVVNIGEIETKFLSPKVSNYIENNKSSITSAINRLMKYKSNKKQNLIFNKVYNELGASYIYNVIITQFLMICTYNNSNLEDKLNSTKITLNLSEKLIDRYYTNLKNKYNKKNNKNLKFKEWRDMYLNDNAEINDILNSDQTKLELGGGLIDILISADMITKTLDRLSFDKTQLLFKVKETFLVNDVKNMIYSLPSKLPMLVPPKEYNETSNGGYLLNDDMFYEDLITHRKDIKEKSYINKDNKIYSVINKMSSIPYKINSELLDYILYDKGSSLLIDSDLYKNPDSEPRLTINQLNKIKSTNSKISLQNTVLEIAIWLKDEKKFYFPMQIDSRGRLYCKTSYFHYQSDSLSKALLLFYDVAHVGRTDKNAMDYFKAYGANCYGGDIDKKSLKDKVDWVNSNKDNIINYRNHFLLDNAKNPLLFLAFCMEYKRFCEFWDDETRHMFNTHLPIQLDATCNGFQHMAMLSKESSIYDTLNLVDEVYYRNRKNSTDDITKKSYTPNDFYNFLLHKINQKINEKLNETELPDRETYVRLSRFVFDRALLKKAIMIIPYNATKRSMTENIRDALEEFKENNISMYKKEGSLDTNFFLMRKDIYTLVNIIEDLIKNDFKKIKKLSAYLEMVSDLFVELNIPIAWLLPTGLTVVQSYLKTKTTTISPFTYSKTKLTLKTIVKDSFDKKKNERALMPNLIHSLDASSLTLLYHHFSTLFVNPQFFSIHDCFATTCEKVVTLKSILASVYMDLYSKKTYLKEFDRMMLYNIEKIGGYKVDHVNRTIYIPHKDAYFELYDIDWVLNEKTVDKEKILEISSQNLAI